MRRRSAFIEADDVAVPSDDWRRMGQEAYLAGKAFRRRSYEPFRPGWDHDHCEFCSRKFFVGAGGHAEDLAKGFATEDAYHWVCEPCFEDFREELAWTVVVP
jgi:hypothetical protein